jgi:hypothetical protein
MMIPTPVDEDSEDSKEEHDNSSFAIWLETKGVEELMKKHPRRNTSSMHVVAQRVREEKGVHIASKYDFTKIKGVDKVILDIANTYLENQDQEPQLSASNTELQGADSEDVQMTDLASYWCMSMAKRTTQDIVFQPYAVGAKRVEDSDYINLFSGLPFDDCLGLGSTLESRSGGSAPCAFATSEAAYIVLQLPDAKFQPSIPLGAALILRHIEQELCGGDVESCAYLLRWLAFGYKYRKKIGVMPIMLGEKGIGKSLIFAGANGSLGLLPRLYGKHWKSVASVSDLMGTFADMQEIHSMFVTIDEAADVQPGAASARQVGAKLRSILTSSTKDHQLKHQTKDSSMPDYRNFVACVNPDRSDAFNIEIGDRRLAMFEGRDKYSKLAWDEGRITGEERTQYFGALMEAIDDKASLQWLARYLVFDVDLSHWDRENIPRTRVRIEQQELNVCPVLRFVQTWRAQTAPNDCDLCYSDHVKNQDGVLQEQTKALQADKPNPLGNISNQYKASDLFNAFSSWCKREGTAMVGFANVNSFTQKLSKFTKDEDDPAKTPQGIVSKKRTNAGARYWLRVGSVQI